MKVLQLLFYAVVCYLLGAIAAAVSAPFVLAQGVDATVRGDLTYSLIPIVQDGGSLVFLGLALAQLAAEVVTNARAQDEALDKKG